MEFFGEKIGANDHNLHANQYHFGVGLLGREFVLQENKNRKYLWYTKLDL